MVAQHASMMSLNDDVLRKILMMLPSKDRIRSVPLVCSRWHSIMEDASMWPIVNAMLRQFLLHHKSDQPNNMQTWLRQRSPGMRQLTLRFDFDIPLLEPALRSVAPTAAHLQQLQLTSTDYNRHLFSVEALACVSQLQQFLTRLEVSFIGTPLVEGSLNRIFASLPALEFVGLHFRTAGPEGDTGTDSDDEPYFPDLPNAFPQSLLRCTRLAHLELCMHFPLTHRYVVSVGGLPHDITALQRLQHLQLGNCVTAPLTCGLSRLTQLTHLAVLQAELQNEALYDPNDDELVALPASLRVLAAFRVPEEVLAQATALESLSLEDTVSLSTAICSLSGLQRLTLLDMGHVADAELAAFAGCTNLRTLCLQRLRLDEVGPLRYPHLTRLQLRGQSSHPMADVLAMISDLPQLEILEVLKTVRVLPLEAEVAEALSRLPKLREVLRTSFLGHVIETRFST